MFFPLGLGKSKRIQKIFQKKGKGLDFPDEFGCNRGMNKNSFLYKWKGSYGSYAMTSFFYFFSMGAFGSILSVYLMKIGMSASQMSFIVSAAGLFSFAMVPLIGYLCDKTGKPKVVAGILLLATGVLGLVFSACREVWALFLLDGLIMSMINSVMPLSERMSGACRYRYGAVRVWGTLGYATAAQAAGFIMETLPPVYLFVLLLGSTVLTVCALFTVDNSALAAPPGNPKEKPKVGFGFLKQPAFLLFLGIAFLFSGASGVNMTYTPVLLTELGVPTGGVGTVLFFSTLVEIPLILFSHRFMDRFSGKQLFVLDFAVMAVQFAVYGFSASAPPVVAAMILLKAIGSTLFVMITLKLVRNLVDATVTTTALSVVNSLNSLGTIAMQNVSGILVDQSGLRFLYLCLMGTAILGLFLSLFLKVHNRERVFDI